MLLEKIAKKKTLADSYRANDRLKGTLSGYAAFYAIQAALLISLTAIHSTSGIAELSAFHAIVSSFPIAMAIGLAICYTIAASILAIASKYDIPRLSAVVSMMSFLLHLTITIALAALAVLLIYGVASSGSQLTPTELSTYVPNGLRSGVTSFPWIIAIAAMVDLLIWIILLFTALSRSTKSFIAALKTVPGLYEYAHEIRVFSSSRMDMEKEFISDILSLSRSYSKSDAEEILEDDERYLIRLASRNGDLVAASLHELPDYSLVAIFGGESNRSINIEILLEDSFNIQKLKAAEACASLRKDELIIEIATRSGWTVDVRDSVMELRRS